MRRITVLVATTALALAACGSDDDGDDGSSSVTAPVGDTTTTAEPATTTTEPSATTEPADPEDLPGEPFDAFPHEDAELAVVGVDRDDVLDLRVGPGTDFEIITELAPTDVGIIATGHNRMVDDEIWVEVEADGSTGWVDASFVLQPGMVDDITAELGEDIEGETMLDLGNAVAELRASEEPPSRIVVVDGPHVGDLGEVTVDVIGLGDDSVGGERLHVFGRPAPGGEAFVLRSVERTVLCSRGVADDGLCV